MGLDDHLNETPIATAWPRIRAEESLLNPPNLQNRMQEIIRAVTASSDKLNPPPLHELQGARLTPEIKAKLRWSGLPILGALGAAKVSKGSLEEQLLEREPN